MHQMRSGLDGMNGAISLLYDAVLQPELWPRALDQIAALSGTMGLMMAPISRQNDRVPFVYASNGLAEACTSFSRDWYATSPFMVYERRSPVIGRCMWDGDVYTLEEMRRLQFYQDYARPYDMAHCMMRGTSQIGSAGRYVMMAPSHLALGVPHPSQRQVFEILTAHVEKALTMYLRLNATGKMLEGVLSAIGQGDCGVLLIDGAGNVAMANDAAQQMDGDGFTISKGKLLASLPGQQAELDRLLSAVLKQNGGTAPATSIALKRANGKRPLLVNAAPMGSRAWELFPGGLASAGIMVVVVDSEINGTLAASSLFRLLGLTEAEARVAAVLGTGAKPEYTAAELGVAIGTIRNHIKSIFSKLDISRQSELVALAARLSILQPAGG